MQKNETRTQSLIENAAPTALSRLRTAGVVLYFLLMTVIMTYPLVLRMRDAMVGQMGDNIYFVWMIGWIKRAIFDLGVNPFNVWFLNYPEGWNMAYTEITPAQLLLALPFTFISGPVFGYNAALLLTFALSGLGMYLWVRCMTKSEGAGLAAGTIYAFIPYHFAHFLIGHLNLSGIQWFPFYFWGFFGILETRRGVNPYGWKMPVLAGVMLGLIGLTSQYYLYMTILVSGFLAGWYFVFMERKRFLQGLFWKNIGMMLLAAVIPVALAVAPYVTLFRQGGLPDRNLGVVRLYSASPTDFILPSTDHFLWGSWVGANFNRDLWIEATLYLGVVSIGLAILAWSKRRKIEYGRLLLLLLPGTVLSIILAMGIDLHWNAEPVAIPLPDALRSLIGRDEAPILLPGYFLFQYLPFYAKLRALMRFGIFALVFCSAAAGLGAGWLLVRFKTKTRLFVTAGLLVLIFLDFYPGPYQEFTSVESRPVDAWLAQQTGNGAVIQFPFIQSEDQEQTYYTLVHNKPFVGGFFNAFPPPQYTRLLPVMAGFPDQASVSQLGELGVGYVLVDRAAYPQPALVREKCEQLGLIFLADVGEQMVFTTGDH